LEDLEGDYYIDGGTRGDSASEDAARLSSSTELIYEGPRITHDESLLLTMAFALTQNFSCSCGRALGITSYSLSSIKFSGSKHFTISTTF